ncbi:MAG: hypothetical protein O3A00_17520 [Planctomycetota bacterium]|nr:hypothetical protein [Planctomycetota bacterium]
MVVPQPDDPEPEPDAASTTPASRTRRSAKPSAIEIQEFFDPPETSDEPSKPVIQRMLEALLDPQAIQWMLTIGGGLCVLGLIIWLVSLGLFKNPHAIAAIMGAASLAVLGAGWFVTLNTGHRIAGRALTFFGCVVAPLNLWYYHTQDLLTLDRHLWIAGVGCVGLYAATVRLLRDPLFQYAVQAGVTLTTLLLMADLQLVNDAGSLALAFLALAVLSIHAERLFPPEGEFARDRFGLPLFWCGHLQLATTLFILLTSQLVGWMGEFVQSGWEGNLLTQHEVLACGIWLAAAYLYLYSDLLVMKVGAYLYVAAVCLVMGVVSLALPHVEQEGLIAVLALLALALRFAQSNFSPDNEKLQRHAVVALVLSGLPVLPGVLLHFRATSVTFRELGLGYESGWGLVVCMLVVAVVHRILAHLSRDHEDWRILTSHFFMTGAGILVAAAALLRQWGWVDWSQQAPLLMLIPIGYVIATRLYRGSFAERPLIYVSQTATAVILLCVFAAATEQGELAVLRPVTQQTSNLLLGLAFVEAAVFYILASVFHRRSWNGYLAAAAGCGALWQFLGYFGISTEWQRVMFAVGGLVLLIVARSRGYEFVVRYRANGTSQRIMRGRGLPVFQCGNVVLTTAIIMSILNAVVMLLREQTAWLSVLAMSLTALSAILAIWIVPKSDWRQWYIAAATAMGAVMFLQMNVLIDLNGWQKLQVFCTGAGLLILATAHWGRFRESEQDSDENVTAGLWLGSVLATVPLFVAMLHYRFVADAPSLWNELGLLTVSILLLVSGCSWQIKSTTALGGSNLMLYLLILLGSIAYRPEIAVGVYLLAGGGLIFVVGIVLSLYRDHLLALPERIAKREGLFRFFSWR